MQDKLKPLPCPFCGTRDTLHFHGDDVICGGCDVSVDIDIWNQRAAAKTIEALVEALKEAEIGLITSSVYTREEALDFVKTALASVEGV